MPTPSGLSLADAEALSDKAQKELLASMPKEGELVKLSIGEGAYKYGIQQGNTINWMDTGEFNPPLTGGPQGERDWQGRTMGSWISSGVSGILGQLGNPSARALNAADYNAQSFSEKTLSSGDFMSLFNTSSQQPLGAPISPVVPDKIAPENSIQGIRSVFGAGWVPSPAFTPELQAKGIYGAVRIKGTNEVYTIGSGGTKETAESYLQKFGTSEQKGIVGEISKEQAIKLGVTDTAQTAVDPRTITPQSMETTDKLDITGTGGTTNEYTADTTNAGINKNVETYNTGKSDREKELEGESDDITTEMKSLLGEDIDSAAAQLTAEEKEDVKAKQKATDDAYAELEAKESEIEILTASYQIKNQAIEGKAITLGSIQGQQAQEYKMYLAQKNLLTAQASSLQAKAFALEGKLDRAQDAADRAVDLKYADRQQRYNNLLALRNIVRDELTDEQNVRFSAIEAIAEQEQTILDYQIDQEKAENSAKLNLIAKYSLVGVDINSTMDDINQAVMGTAKYAQETRLADGGGGPTITPQAKALNKDLTKEVQNLFDGDYGVEGAREKLIAKLQTLARVNYPELVNEIPKMVYGTDGYEAILPDGYEQELKSTVTKTTPFSGIPSFENIQ